MSDEIKTVNETSAEPVQKEPATLIKTFTGRIGEDGEKAVIMLYRTEDGKKHVGFIPRAVTDYYVVKDKESPESLKPINYMPIDRVEHKRCYSDQLYQVISEETGMQQYYQSCIMNNRRRELANLLRHPWIYGCDGDISDYYIRKFHAVHEPLKKSVVHKAFFDIEVDLQQNSPDPKDTYQGFPDEKEAPCPINVISLYDHYSRTFKVFYLIQENNESQMKWAEDLEARTKEILDWINSQEFTKGKYKCRGDVKNLELLGFKDEMELIRAFVNAKNEFDPDFLLAWNVRYDIQTIMNRLLKTHLKGKEYQRRNEMSRFMSDPKYLAYTVKGKNHTIRPSAFFLEDTTSRIEERGDYYEDTSGCTVLDQMLLYAAIRRSEGVLDSYALDAVCNEEIGARKLEFSNGAGISNAAWLDWDNFVKYNIRDVILLSLLEEKCMDVDTIQTLSEVTCTRHNKVLMKTVCLRNYVEKYISTQGYVLTNARRIDYGDAYTFNQKMNELMPLNKYLTDNPEGRQYMELFSNQTPVGGFVAKPELNDNTGVDEFDTGNLSNYLYENVVDEDVGAMYPSIMMAFNLDSDTMIGKFFLPSKEIKEKLMVEYGYSDELFAQMDEDPETSKKKKPQKRYNFNNREISPQFDMADMLTDGIISRDWNKVGEKFFDLPNTYELINELKNKA